VWYSQICCEQQEHFKLARFLCSKCSPFAVTHERRLDWRACHFMTAASITRVRPELWGYAKHFVDLLHYWPHSVVHRMWVWGVWRPKAGDEIWSLQQINCFSCPGWAHCLVKTCEILTADKYLAKVSAPGLPQVLTVNCDTKLIEMDAGCSKSQQPIVTSRWRKHAVRALQ